MNKKVLGSRRYLVTVFWSLSIRCERHAAEACLRFMCQSLAIAPHFVEFCRDLHFLNGIITHPSLKQNDNFEQVPVDLDVEFAALGFGKTFCDRKTKSGTFCVS